MHDGVQAKCRVAGGSVLHCAVTEAGPGIPAEFRARVYEPCFWLAHHCLVGATDRTSIGLGLDGRTHIVTAHRGHIWCDTSMHGVGTRLALTLPGEGRRIRTG